MTTLEKYNYYFYIENNQLFWKNPRARRNNRGDKVGSLWKDERHYTGYWVCTLEGKKLKNHNIMYQMYNNLEEIPANLVVDHINRNSEDNSINNLRLVTQTENIWNSRIQKNNTSGHKGVHWYERNNKWGVRVSHNHKRIFLGLFSDFEKAVAVYEENTKKIRKPEGDNNLKNEGEDHVE